MGNFAGLDWASDKHDVLVCDDAGEELLAATFAHSETGLDALCRTLVRLSVQLVAIERPDGLLVCELARTDHHSFRILEPDGDRTKALRALTRAREDLVQSKVALGNQLRAELERFWPAPIGLFNELDSPISLAFLERYPSSIDAQALGEKRLGAFLVRQRYSGGKTPTELLAKLRTAPEGRAGGLESQARSAVVLALVAALKPLVCEISKLTRQIATSVRAHTDVTIFLSLFRNPDSVICAATLLAEIGDCRARYPTRDTLAADAGQAPIAVESGKRKVAAFRWGCDKRLRSAFCTLADSTRHWHPWAADHYAKARARGHDHPRAIRTLGRAGAESLALLARRRRIRPRTPPRPPTTHRRHHPRIEPPARPPRHPADGRRHRHRTGGPKGRARSA